MAYSVESDILLTLYTYPKDPSPNLANITKSFSDMFL